MGVDGLVNGQHKIEHIFCPSGCFWKLLSPEPGTLAMSSKSSPFPYAKMRDRDMGIGGTSLDLSFPQVIGINSCIENKYLQVYRNQLQLFYGTLEPWLVCCCCLLIQ